MGVQESRLTLEGLAHKLEALTEKLGGLERENAELRNEVVALRSSGTHGGGTAEMRGSDTRQAGEDASKFEGQVSRKWLLSKAGAAAVGTVAAVAAGTLLNPREAEAAHSDTLINAHTVSAHRIHVESENGAKALSARTVSDFDSAVYGENSNGVGVEGASWGVGPGVEGAVYSSNGTGVQGWTVGSGTGVHGIGGDRGVIGESENGIGILGKGKHGLHGTSSTTGWGAVVGVNEGDGYGVVGDATSATYSGVWGRNYGVGAGVRGQSINNNGLGVWAKGLHGVSGEATSGVGVQGISTSGYGGQFKGGKAQLRIVPKATKGRPTTGAHAKGEIYMDSAGTLFVCTVGGTPGTWRRFATAVT